MMRITRAEIIAVTCSYINLSDRSARFFEFCNQAVSLMLELTITSARQWSPDIAATVDCPTDITTINHKAPRLYPATPISVLTFWEVFRTGLPVVVIPTNGKEAIVVRRRLLIYWVADTGEVTIISNSLHAHNDVITMISGFLTSVISSSDHASISRNALRWLLISTIFYSGFFSSEAFDKRTNRVGYRCSR